MADIWSFDTVDELLAATRIAENAPEDIPTFYIHINVDTTEFDRAGERAKRAIDRLRRRGGAP